MDGCSDEKHVAVGITFVQELGDIISEFLGVEGFKNRLDKNVLGSWLLTVKIEVIRKNRLQGHVVGT